MYTTGQVSIFLGVREPNCSAKLAKQLSEFEDMTIVGTASQSTEIVVSVGKLKPDILIVDAAALASTPEVFGKVIKSGSEKTKILLLGFQGTLQEFLPLFQFGIFGNCSSAATASLLRIAVLSIVKGCVWFQPGTQELPNKQSILSNREKEVLQLVMKGHKNASIAALLQISPETVKSHMHRMMEKFVVHSRTQLVVEAIKQQVC